MLSRSHLCVLAMLTTTAMSMPLAGTLETKRSLSVRGEKLTACFTKHVEAISAATACGWGGAEIATFELPYISVSQAIFQKGYTGSNPNANPICGRKVYITNLNNGKTLTGMVMDLNGATSHVQSCKGPDGIDRGPSSVDVGPTGLDALGFNDGPLAALEYEIDWDSPQVVVPAV